jgi:hypothetical protein
MKLRVHDSIPCDLPEVESPEVQYYQIHGLPLMIRSNRRLLFELFDEQFGSFCCTHQPAEPLLEIAFYTLPSAWRPEIAVSQEIEMRIATDVMLAQPRFAPVLYYFGAQMFLVTDILQGYGVGSIAASATVEDLRFVYWQALYRSVLYMLWGRGLFSIHAAAVADDLRSIVIAGEPGHGKTSLMLHLLQAGLRYMSDDRVFLRASADALEILAFPSRIRATPQTAAFFPELQFASSVSLPQHYRKKHLCAQILHIEAARPCLLVLPEVTPDTPGAVVPISRSEVIIDLIARNTIVHDLPRSQENLRVLSHFVQQVSCYRVRLGQDMRAITHQIVELLQD